MTDDKHGDDSDDDDDDDDDVDDEVEVGDALLASSHSIKRYDV